MSLSPLSLPKWLPPLTPISYYVGHEQAGYTYKKLVGYKLVRVKGKKRRVRRNVYKTITVGPRQSLTWAVQLPALRQRWLNVGDYQQGIEAAREMEGFEVTERDMEIFHSSPADDVIHATEEIRGNKSFYFGEPSLFVWRKKQLPVNIKVFGRADPFRMVRIWFWIYHNENKEYRIWCRSSTIDGSNFQESYDFAGNLYQKVSDDIEESYDYLECHGLIAWTAYALNEKATRYDNRRLKKQSGGSE